MINEKRKWNEEGEIGLDGANVDKIIIAAIPRLRESNCIRFGLRKRVLQGI